MGWDLTYLLLERMCTENTAPPSGAAGVPGMPPFRAMDTAAAAACLEVSSMQAGEDIVQYSPRHRTEPGCTVCPRSGLNVECRRDAQVRCHTKMQPTE